MQTKDGAARPVALRGPTTRDWHAPLERRGGRKRNWLAPTKAQQERWERAKKRDARPPADKREQPLSPTEQHVYALIARGCSGKQIARQLGVGEQTIKTHTTAILRKMDVGSRYELIARYYQDRIAALSFTRAVARPGCAAARPGPALPITQTQGTTTLYRMTISA